MPEGEDAIEEFSIYDVKLVSGSYEDTITEDEIKIEIDEDVHEEDVKGLFEDN